MSQHVVLLYIQHVQKLRVKLQVDVLLKFMYSYVIRFGVRYIYTHRKEGCHYNIIVVSKVSKSSIVDPTEVSTQS